MKNKRKTLLILCGIMLFAIVLLYSCKAVEEWNRRGIFEDIMAGDFSAVQGLDAKKMHELEYVYTRMEEDGRLSWIECDINEDDQKELLMIESLQNGRGSVVAGIFMTKGSRCTRILWDVVDYGSCYYLVENMIIQYSENHGLGMRYCYVKYEIDSEGKMTPFKRFEIIDISEKDDIAIGLIERGFADSGTYYVVTDYEKDDDASETETKLSREEWMAEFHSEIGDYETVNLKIMAHETENTQ